MEDSRQLRSCGSTLTLGGIEYRLEAVEGVGGSTIVYRASYPDALNRDASHQVFIKELFPVSPYGDITRGADGSVCCGPKSAGLMEQARLRFRSGNQINLELLRLVPSATAGNINSYEAYGTYYSVLTLHGGENLLQYLKKHGKLSLRESVQIMQQLLKALGVFHRHRLLHLDISPDNILLLPGQVLLIDFNSSWELDNPNTDDFAFSCKKGYSAPEVLLQNKNDIGPASDIYACCAVWFHLLSGRRLTEGEQAGNLRHSVVKMISALQDVPQTAAAKTAQILLRGLHPLARKRHQTIEALQADLTELVGRMNGFGVTKSALWEASAAQQKKNNRQVCAYLSQPIAGTEQMTPEEVCQRLEQREKYLLTGAGGIGKSRFLQELWKQKTANYRPEKPVYLYLALKDYQVCSGETQFIQRSILRMLRFDPRQPHWQDALHALEQILDQSGPNGLCSVVLLLDGLNETGPDQEKLLLEIESLSRQPGVGILVSDRTDAVLTYGLPAFLPISLLPLTAKQVESQLLRENLELPKEEKLRQLLTNPMLLFLYLEIARPVEGQNQRMTLPETQNEMVVLYLDHFCRRAMRADSGNPGRQLCTRYMIRHLLPEIAAEMRRQSKSILTVDELMALARRSYKTLHSALFGLAFPEYLGKTRLMLEKIGSPEEWFDFAIREQLTDRFGLLVSTPQGQVTLLHDNFQDPLAGQAAENRHRFASKRRRRWQQQGALLLFAGVLLMGMVTALWHIRESQTGYTEEEKAIIYDSLVELNRSLSVWNTQISAQSRVLEQASISDVLDNRDPYARERLRGEIELQKQSLAALYTVSVNVSLLEDLREIEEHKKLFSVDLFEDLCVRHSELDPATQEGIGYLEEALCDKDSPYSSRDKRERLVNAYKEYLESEVRYLSYRLAILMSEMTTEQQNEILEAMPYMDALDGFYDGPGSVEPERLPEGSKHALESLKDARREMNAQGLSLDWPEPEALYDAP